MASRAFVTCLVATTLLVSAAQAQASLSGTMRLVTQDDDRRDDEERTIFLLRDSDELHRRLAGVCRSHEEQTRVIVNSLERIHKQVADTMQAPTEDPWTAYWAHETALRNGRISTRRLLASSTRDSIRAALATAMVDSMVTGKDARFRFTGLPAGRYILFSEWLRGPLIHQWWLPVDLPAGAALERSPASSSAAADQLFCGHR